MATVRDLITRTLRTLGATAQGEIPTADEAEDARLSANEMLEMWSLESLMVFHMPEVIQTLVPGKSTYTWGPGGDWDLARPDRVDSVTFRFVSSGAKWPVTILTDLQHRTIPVPQTTSTVTWYIYFDDDFPVLNATVYPVPTEANELFLYPWQSLGSFPSLDTVIAFPTGYAAALRYNLAEWLAPEYEIDVLPPRLASLAAQSKRVLKTNNSPREVMSLDSRLPAGTPVYGYVRGIRGYR